jgi:hypothetical protein
MKAGALVYAAAVSGDGTGKFAGSASAPSSRQSREIVSRSLCR